MNTQIKSKNKYYQLGASLYTPATNKHLVREMGASGSTKSHSMIIDTEDAVAPEHLETALENLQAALKTAPAKEEVKRLRFIRPRNPKILERILKMDCIDKIDGFVLPKCTIESIIIYREILENCPHTFGIMPTIECIDMTRTSNIEQFKKILDTFGKTEVICIRIGGNDLFNELGLKRHPKVTIYETPLRVFIEKIVIGFRTSGYEIAAPVFDIVNDRITLERELEFDMSYGLYAKTAIQPAQAEFIEGFLSSYVKDNYNKALSVVDPSAVDAVYLSGGQMMEKTCHINWAKRIVQLSDSF
ncbi:aldolase/citrate lyase family protein [Vibrio splendidus]|nr:aldolase/citrate lyase family protein [Vibrio splendidus]MCC4883098.1 HpcH/HpaI aldolase/citrate lyase family protein [Vibrio splendidus]